MDTDRRHHPRKSPEIGLYVFWASIKRITFGLEVSLGLGSNQRTPIYGYTIIKWVQALASKKEHLINSPRSREEPQIRRR